MSSEKQDFAPILRYNNDPDVGLIEMSLDGELVSSWNYEDDPKDAFNEFKKIFTLGLNYQKPEALAACSSLYTDIHVSELPKFPPSIQRLWYIGQEVYNSHLRSTAPQNEKE